MTSMSSTLIAPVAIRPAALPDIAHLLLLGKITHRSAEAMGHGGFSEVFKGRCWMGERGEMDVAMKRLRFHLADVSFKKVSPSSVRSRLSCR